MTATNQGINLDGHRWCVSCIDGKHNRPDKFVPRAVAFKSKDKALCACPCHPENQRILTPAKKKKSAPAMQESFLSTSGTIKIGALLLAVFLLPAWTASCGGAGYEFPPLPKVTAASVDGFRNQTTLPTGAPSDALGAETLWGQWRAAMQGLATQPICYLDGHCMAPIPEAAGYQPTGQAVVAVPDWTDQQLAELTGDPRWITLNPQPSHGFGCGGQAAEACVLDHVIYIVASEQTHPQYEMQNIYLLSKGLANDR